MKQPDITYRDDEITIIFKNCNSLPELNKALFMLGYLNRHGAQRIRSVVYKLFALKEEQLIKNLKRGRNC